MKILSRCHSGVNCQQGVALLMAILVVVFVAIISVNMLTQRQLQIFRTTNIYNKEQSWQYIRAVELWAKSVLAEDYKDEIKKSGAFDGRQDVWNKALKNLQGIKAAGQIRDLQGRFNLNNLYYKGKVLTQWLNAYRRLLALLALPTSLADSLVDWLDADSLASGSEGAEDDYYLNLQHPYRAANGPLVSLSELYLVRGYSADVIEKLKPYVYVVDGLTAVNVNTSSVSVLQSLFKGVDKGNIESLLEFTQSSAFESKAQLVKSELLKAKKIDRSLISVSSHYFMLESQVENHGYTIHIQSILKRDKEGEVSIISRRESTTYE